MMRKLMLGVASAIALFLAQPSATWAANSPDGTFTCARKDSTTLTATSGTWTWYTAATWDPDGGFWVLRNNQIPPGPIEGGTQMVVQNGGKLFLLSSGAWYVFTSPMFVAGTPNPIPPSCGGPPPPVQTPLAVSFSPPGPISVADNVATGTGLTAVQVSTSDGNAFAGTLSITAQSQAGMVSLSSASLPSNVQIASISSANDGAQTATIQATENGVSKSAVLNITVNASAGGTTLVPTLDGNTLLGPQSSDCQVYKNSAGAVAIDCPVAFIPVSGSHTVQQSEFGSVLVASGGGTVSFSLPAMTPVGRNYIGFVTDGNTAITITPQSPATMRGSSLIGANGTLNASANSSGAVYLAAPNLYQADFR